MSAVIEIREKLKSLGYNNRMVSVKGSPCGYSYSIDVEVKDPVVNFNKVKDIVNNYSRIRRDEYSGEILEGCNTYTSVEISDVVMKKWAEKYLPELKEKVPSLKEHSGDMITINEKYYVWLSQRGICASNKLNDTDFPMMYDKNGLEYLAVDLYISDQN